MESILRGEKGITYPAGPKTQLVKYCMVAIKFL